MDGSCYETYMTLCEPFRFADQWACISADPCAYRGPSDPNAALAALVDRFSEQELIDARIAQRDVDGHLTMHAFLAEPEVAVVALRDPETASIANLMTGRGCVAGELAPLFATRRDRHTVVALAGSFGTVLLTGSLEDAILLRSLGLAAAPIAGVAELGHHDVTLLGEIFNVQRDPSAHEEVMADEDDQAAVPATPHPTGARSMGNTVSGADAGLLPQPLPQIPGSPHLSGSGSSDKQVDDCATLTIVRWSPLSLSPVEPVAVTEAVKYLEELGAFRGLNLLDVNEWTSHADDMGRIKFALDRSQAIWVKDAVLDSLHVGTNMLNFSQKSVTRDARPHDLVTAIEHLQEMQLDENQDRSRRGRKEALANYQRMLMKHVSGPMRRQAQASPDPIHLGQQLVLAELVELFMQKMPTVREQVLRGEGPASAAQISNNKSVSELLAISKQVITLTKEMTPSKRNPKITSRHRTGLVIDSPRFGTLVCPTRN